MPSSQPERADVDRPDPGRCAVRGADRDLGGASSDIADRPLRREDRWRCERTCMGEGCLLRRAEQPRAHSACADYCASELLAVRTLSPGRRDENGDVVDAEGAGCCDCVGDGLRDLDDFRFRDGATSLDLVTKSDGRPRLAYGLRHAVAHVCYEQTCGVRAHVDDPDTHLPSSCRSHPTARVPRIVDLVNDWLRSGAL